MQTRKTALYVNPQVRCGFYGADFHEIRNCSMALRGDLH